MVYVTVVVWASDLLVPVTDTGYIPAEPKLHDRVEVPAPVTLAGIRVHEVLLVVRLTTPAKALIGVTVTVEFPAAFTFTLRLVGLAVKMKS
jgi:hypothetical protein